jgi:hypothetical protein
MELTIYTYGHLDAMFYVLNGIAMLCNHSVVDGLIKMMSLVATSYYGLKMAYSGASGQYKQYAGKILAMIMVINGLLTPKTDMLIHDHVTKQFEKVDNLPVGFAFPVGALEAFGEILTAGFEQAFTSLKNANYRDYGMVFGARLVQDSRNWRIKTPEFTENMHNFLRRCVIRDAMIGYRYTAQDLLTTDNIWSLISANPNTLRKLPMRSKKTWELVSCKEAALSYIAPSFLPEIDSLKKRNLNTDFATATNSEKTLPRSTANLINNMLATNIELAFSSYIGSNNSAENLIKQQMMINSLSDISDEYGFARASMQQESSWRIAGDLAATYLPILLSVIKGLVYSSFIFMIPLMLLSGGMSKYLGYLTVVSSLQLWPALNAILNMFIDLYSSSQLSGIAGGIISFATFSEIGNYADKIVAVASGLQMSVPFLAFAIVQGGVGGFIHLAGNITGASQSAATSVASEIATGNRSLDNISIGNMQYVMQSGFKTDWSQSYASGVSSFQHMDGTMEKVLGSGQTIMQSGSGLTMSGGGVKFGLESSSQNQISNGIQTSESLLQSDQRAYSDARSYTTAKAADYVSHLAQREHNGETFNYESMGEQGKTLQQAVNHTKQLKQQHNYGWEQATSAALKASANGSLPFGIASIGAEGSVSANNSSDQSVGEDAIINRDNHISESYNNLIKAASNNSWAKENSIDKSYADSVRSSYEKQQRLEDQVSRRQEEVNSWHQAKTNLESNGASRSQDMYHEVEQGLMKEYGMSAHEAHKNIESGGAESRKIWNNIVNHEVEGLRGEVSQARSNVSGAKAEQRLNEFNERYEHQINQDHTLPAKIAAQGANLNSSIGAAYQAATCKSHLC